VQTVLFGAVHSHVPGRAARQIFSSKWGAARWGGIAYVYVCLECSYDLPEGHPGQLAYPFVAYHIAPNFNILCLLLL
jgi:hypothetical protein